MTEELEIMKLKEVRLMNTLNGEKELVWKLNVDRYTKQLRSELEEAKKDMQITRDTEEEINNKLLGKISDLQKENEELKKEVVNLKEAYMVAKGGPYKR